MLLNDDIGYTERLRQSIRGKFLHEIDMTESVKWVLSNEDTNKSRRKHRIY